MHIRYKKDKEGMQLSFQSWNILFKQKIFLLVLQNSEKFLSTVFLEQNRLPSMHLMGSQIALVEIEGLEMHETFVSSILAKLSRTSKRKIFIYVFQFLEIGMHVAVRSKFDESSLCVLNKLVFLKMTYW